MENKDNNLKNGGITMKKIVLLSAALLACTFLIGCSEDKTATASKPIITLGKKRTDCYYTKCPECNKELEIDMKNKIYKTKCSNCGCVYNITYEEHDWN